MFIHYTNDNPILFIEGIKSYLIEQKVINHWFLTDICDIIPKECIISLLKSIYSLSNISIYHNLLKTASRETNDIFLEQFIKAEKILFSEKINKKVLSYYTYYDKYNKTKITKRITLIIYENKNNFNEIEKKTVILEVFYFVLLFLLFNKEMNIIDILLNDELNNYHLPDFIYKCLMDMGLFGRLYLKKILPIYIFCDPNKIYKNYLKLACFVYIGMNQISDSKLFKKDISVFKKNKKRYFSEFKEQIEEEKREQKEKPGKTEKTERSSFLIKNESILLKIKQSMPTFEKLIFEKEIIKRKQIENKDVRNEENEEEEENEEDTNIVNKNHYLYKCIIIQYIFSNLDHTIEEDKIILTNGFYNTCQSYLSNKKSKEKRFLEYSQLIEKKWFNLKNYIKKIFDKWNFDNTDTSLNNKKKKNRIIFNFEFVNYDYEKRILSLNNISLDIIEQDFLIMNNKIGKTFDEYNTKMVPLFIKQIKKESNDFYKSSTLTFYNGYMLSKLLLHRHILMEKTTKTKKYNLFYFFPFSMIITKMIEKLNTKEFNEIETYDSYLIIHLLNSWICGNSKKTKNIFKEDLEYYNEKNHIMLNNILKQTKLFITKEYLLIEEINKILLRIIIRTKGKKKIIMTQNDSENSEFIQDYIIREDDNDEETSDDEFIDIEYLNKHEKIEKDITILDTIISFLNIFDNHVIYPTTKINLLNMINELTEKEQDIYKTEKSILQSCIEASKIRTNYYRIPNTNSGTSYCIILYNMLLNKKEGILFGNKKLEEEITKGIKLEKITIKRLTYNSFKENIWKNKIEELLQKREIKESNTSPFYLLLQWIEIIHNLSLDNLLFLMECDKKKSNNISYLKDSIDIFTKRLTSKLKQYSLFEKNMKIPWITLYDNSRKKLNKRNYFCNIDKIIKLIF